MTSYLPEIKYTRHLLSFPVYPNVHRVVKILFTEFQNLHLEINQTTVQKWYKLGLLQGKHASSQKALWIARTEEVEQRLGGQASFDPRMISVKALCKSQGKTWEQVLRWCQEEGHQVYRFRRGTTFRFYVLPQFHSL